MSSILVVDVHLRDVLESLIKRNCSSPADFEWTKQLRFYWEDDQCVARQTHSAFHYGLEYLGNTPRLVITPLTERFVSYSFSRAFVSIFISIYLDDFC